MNCSMNTEDRVIDWIVRNEAGSFPDGALVMQKIVTRDELELVMAKLEARGLIYRHGNWRWGLGPYSRKRYDATWKLRDRWHDDYPV